MRIAYLAIAFAIAACGGNSSDPGTDPDASTPGDDTGTPDAGPPSTVLGLGAVSTITDLAECPRGAPANSTCKQIQVTGCPGIEGEAADAYIAMLEPSGPLRGTVVHFKGGGGEDWEIIGTNEFRDAGFRQVFVSWLTDWEQTDASGIKTAACRPATVLRWAFDEIHEARRDLGFCTQGKSGGSGQVGYALEHYGADEYVDYANELSGPPFARIDLGCDGDAPATIDVCGAAVTTRLPDKVGPWENIPQPLVCGSQGVPADELARWHADSIVSDGGDFDHPHTRIEFHACTYMASPVTAMSWMYYQQLLAIEGPDRVAYNCYDQADGCRSEELGDGTAIAIQALIDGCAPQHMP